MYQFFHSKMDIVKLVYFKIILFILLTRRSVKVLSREKFTRFDTAITFSTEEKLNPSTKCRARENFHLFPFVDLEISTRMNGIHFSKKNARKKAGNIKK